MRANGTFSVKSFSPAAVTVEPAISTALPVGVATMEKSFDGDIAGRSATLFTAAFDQATGVGTYVAMESFEGSVGGLTGAFNFVHSASTSGSDRTAEYFAIVPSSGAGELAGITGDGGLTVDPDGTHRIWLEYQTGVLHRPVPVGRSPMKVCLVSGHANGVSRDIGMGWPAGSADVESAPCHHCCHR